jgi:hypothetical protein
LEGSGLGLSKVLPQYLLEGLRERKISSRITGEPAKLLICFMAYLQFFLLIFVFVLDLYLVHFYTRITRNFILINFFRGLI